jgi:hypothetical protein
LKNHNMLTNAQRQQSTEPAARRKPAQVPVVIQELTVAR